jgi:diguanylate cyclase (GGDEF)-like protein/PAS domain S-box-containing protein
VGAAAGALTLSAAAQRLAPVILDATPWALCLVGLYAHALVTRVDQQAIGLLAQGVMIRRTESLMRHVVENSFDAIVTVGDDGLIETFNPAARRLFGYPDGDPAGRPLSEVIHPGEVGGRDSLFARATDGPVEAFGRNRDGREFPVEVVVTSIDTENETKLVAVARDISERKVQQDRLRHQATHDPLTDLPNRFLLRERIDRALAGASQASQTLAVLLLDLDRFKEINDALGHRTGDLLLKQVARRLQAPIDSSATIARLGGDEFAVLLPDATLEKTLQLAWKLIESLRLPFDVEGFSLQVDTSLGITLYPDHGHDAETLMQRADVAMYVAKRRRASLAVYRPEFDFNSRRHLMLRADLRDAIDAEQLTLSFQPKVLALNDSIIGAEALVRWQHPKHGSIPPDEFIGLAEHSGLIRPLTHLVLDKALRQAAEWRRERLDLAISVNLSARNLLEEDLPHALTRLLSQHQVLPEQLTLEITESVIMEDPERALKIVTRLQELGVGISIDDFGTGYSSLGYLMRLPAKEMKIDKSFVMKMEKDPASATIVHSTIELAHNLGLMVVAEGVETESVWNVLKELGCDIGQGYYFGKPLPPAELSELVRRLHVPDAALAAFDAGGAPARS